MPFVFAFGEVNAFSFYRMGHNHSRLIRISGFFSRCSRRNDLRKAGSIDFQNAPAEFLENAFKINTSPWVTPVAMVLFARPKQPAKLLQAVSVENRSKISRSEERR